LFGCGFAALGKSMSELTRLESLDINCVFANELPEGASVFLCGLGSFGNVALAGYKESFNVGPFKVIDYRACA